MAVQPGSPKFCSNCGAPLAPGAHNCSQCGAAVGSVLMPSEPEEQPYRDSGLDDLASSVAGSGLIDSADAYIKYKIVTGVIGGVISLIVFIVILSHMATGPTQPVPVIPFLF